LQGQSKDWATDHATQWRLDSEAAKMATSKQYRKDAVSRRKGSIPVYWVE